MSVLVVGVREELLRHDTVVHGQHVTRGPTAQNGSPHGTALLQSDEREALDPSLVLKLRAKPVQESWSGKSGKNVSKNAAQQKQWL